jgi:hypothetical protein
MEAAWRSDLGEVGILAEVLGLEFVEQILV